MMNRACYDLNDVPPVKLYLAVVLLQAKLHPHYQRTLFEKLRAKTI